MLQAVLAERNVTIDEKYDKCHPCGSNTYYRIMRDYWKRAKYEGLPQTSYFNTSVYHPYGGTYALAPPHLSVAVTLNLQDAWAWDFKTWYVVNGTSYKEVSATEKHNYYIVFRRI